MENIEEPDGKYQMYIYLRSTSKSVGGNENEDNAAPASSDDCSGVLGLEGGKVSIRKKIERWNQLYTYM